MRSSSSPRAVSIRIGRSELARTRRHTSKPSWSGSIRSSTSASKRVACELRRARSPRRAGSRPRAARAEILRDHVGEACVVVDHQDASIRLVAAMRPTAAARRAVASPRTRTARNLRGARTLRDLVSGPPCISGRESPRARVGLSTPATSRPRRRARVESMRELLRRARLELVARDLRLRERGQERVAARAVLVVRRLHVLHEAEHDRGHLLGLLRRRVDLVPARSRS